LEAAIAMKQALRVGLGIFLVSLPAAPAAEGDRDGDKDVEHVGKEAENAGKAARDEYPPIFYLRDGSRVASRPTFDAICVATRYGTLRVPTEDIVRIHFSRRVDPALRKEIESQITRLSSDDFDEREDATALLRKIGASALPALRRAAESDSEEARNRAESLLDDIGADESGSPAAGDDEMAPSKDENDIVVSRRFTIKGRVLEKSFPTASRYGPLEFEVADVIGINFRYGARVSESLTVSGQNTVPANWVNTKIQLFKGQRLEIRASGQLYISNYNLTSGPAGCSRTGSYKSFPSLSLIAKVGKKGKEFLVGASYRSKAPAGGVLYLGVVPYRRYTPTGSYRVKVEGGK
jgi:hypothetical protein